MDGVVVDVGRLDHHADSRPACIAKHLSTPRLRRGDPLERLEPLDVVLHRLAARARAGSRDRVGRLHEHGLDGLRLDVEVVRLDGVHDGVRLAVLARHLRADHGVRALDLVRQRLADVVQQRGAARRLLTDAPSSEAMIAATCAHSSEWLSTFWP